MTALKNLVRHIRASKRLCLSLFFLSAGTGIGAWASSLPLLAAEADLNKGELGALLLCFALGAIFLMTVAGRFIDKIGNNYPLCLAGNTVFGGALSAIPFIDSPLILGCLIFIVGCGFGTLDVCMNTEASQTERARDRNLMSSFHAMFSVGNIAGALAVALIISMGGRLAACLAGSGALVAALGGMTIFLAAKTSWKSERSLEEPGPGTASAMDAEQKVLVFVLGAVAFLAFLAEGGIMDWTAVFMVGNLQASEAVGAYAFSVFAGAMAICRSIGDVLTRHFGHVKMLRIGSFVCAASLSMMLFAGSVRVSLFALAICGIGVANMIPAVFAAAGKVGSESVGRAMSIVTTMGYGGLLLGPAMLGFVAHAWDLAVSLALVVFAFGVIAAITIPVERRLNHYIRNTHASREISR